MHADVLGDVLEHHWLYLVDAIVEKFPLAVHNALDDTVDRLSAMLDVAEQVDGRADLFLDEILGFLCSVALFGEAMIGRADAETRAAVIGKEYDIVVIELFDIDLGRDKDRVFG